MSSNTGIQIFRGDTVTIPLTFDDGEDIPEPIDITGWTVFFTVKNKNDKSPNDDSALIKKTVTTHVSPTLGQTEIVLSSLNTSVATGKHVYDIQTKDDLGNIQTIVSDTFEVINDVTKRIT